MTIAPGAVAPEFTLPDAEGRPRSLAELTADGVALLAFFKTTCPTCRLAFPVFGTLADRYGDRAAVVAVSQDPLDRAKPWLDELGFHGPVLDDVTGDFATSTAYGLVAVPTAVLIDRERRVVATAEGWNRAAMNDFARLLGEDTGGDASAVSTETDGRPPHKPG